MNTGKRIVWISNRHMPCPAQIQELNCLFPKCEIIYCNKMFRNVHELIDHFKSVDGDEMVVILPMTMIKKLVEMGWQPIRSIMKTVTENDQYDIFEKGRNGTVYMRFVGYERVTDVYVHTEILSWKRSARTA